MVSLLATGAIVGLAVRWLYNHYGWSKLSAIVIWLGCTRIVLPRAGREFFSAHWYTALLIGACAFGAYVAFASLRYVTEHPVMQRVYELRKRRG